MNKEEQIRLYQIILNGEIPLIEKMGNSMDPYPYPISTSVEVAKAYYRTSKGNLSKSDIEKLSKLLVVNG